MRQFIGRVYSHWNFGIWAVRNVAVNIHLGETHVRLRGPSSAGSIDVFLGNLSQMQDFRVLSQTCQIRACIVTKLYVHSSLGSPALDMQVDTERWPC